MGLIYYVGITYWKIGEGFQSVDPLETGRVAMGMVWRLLDIMLAEALDICRSLSTGSPAETGGVMGCAGYEICGTCVEKD